MNQPHRQADGLGRALKDATRATRAAVREAEADLARLRQRAALLQDAAERGNLDPLVAAGRTAWPDLESIGGDLMSSANYATVMAGGWNPETSAFIRSRIAEAVQADRDNGTERVRTVLLHPGWRVTQRADTVMPAGEHVRRACIALAGEDAHVAVVLGMVLGGQRRGWAASDEVIAARRELPKAPTGAFFTLGCAFPDGAGDGDLDTELVELLVTMPHPEVAARLARQLAPIHGWVTSGRVAKRLEELDILVQGVTGPAGP